MFVRTALFLYTLICTIISLSVLPFFLNKPRNIIPLRNIIIGFGNLRIQLTKLSAPLEFFFERCAFLRCFGNNIFEIVIIGTWSNIVVFKYRPIHFHPQFLGVCGLLSSKSVKYSSACSARPVSVSCCAVSAFNFCRAFSTSYWSRLILPSTFPIERRLSRLMIVSCTDSLKTSLLFCACRVRGYHACAEPFPVKAGCTQIAETYRSLNSDGRPIGAPIFMLKE